MRHAKRWRSHLQQWNDKTAPNYEAVMDDGGDGTADFEEFSEWWIKRTEEDFSSEEDQEEEEEEEEEDDDDDDEGEEEGEGLDGVKPAAGERTAAVGNYSPISNAEAWACLACVNCKFSTTVRAAGSHSWAGLHVAQHPVPPSATTQLSKA